MEEASLTATVKDFTLTNFLLAHYPMPVRAGMISSDPAPYVADPHSSVQPVTIPDVSGSKLRRDANQHEFPAARLRRQQSNNR
jgi:hypothetical protein